MMATYLVDLVSGEVHVMRGDLTICMRALMRGALPCNTNVTGWHMNRHQGQHQVSRIRHYQAKLT